MITRSILLALLFLAHAAPLSAAEVLAVTEEFAPYNYTDPVTGVFGGVSTQIVMEAARRAGVAVRIESLPWARAYGMAQSAPNTMIFSITRTPQREKLFKWAGSLAPISFYLYKLKARDDIRPATVQEARRFTVGAVRDTAEMQYLLANGFEGENLGLADSHENNLAKLLKGRVDMLIWDELAFVDEIKRLGYDPGLFEKVLFVSEASSELYLAFSPATDDALVRLFSDALAQMKAQGVIQSITGAYLK